MISKGDTLRPFAPQIMQDSVNAFNLIGYTVTCSIVDQNAQPIGGGALTIDNPANGQCHRDFLSGEVAIPGTYTIYTWYTQISTNKTDHLDNVTLVIQWAP